MKIAETCSKWIPLEFSISYANEYARSNEKKYSSKRHLLFQYTYPLL